MYAIMFELDKVACNNNTHTKKELREAYLHVDAFLQRYGFEKKKKGLYFGTDDHTPPICCLVIRKLVEKMGWLFHCFKYINMIRITDVDDMMPVVKDELSW